MQKIASLPCRDLFVGVAERRAKTWAGFFLVPVKDSPVGGALIFLVCLADVLGTRLQLLGAKP
ncbi:hypothetical protein K4G64_21215 [Streptomyces sp. WAC04114]|nr:hypothetical protein [Streptomyces sp. WAC04114]